MRVRVESSWTTRVLLIVAFLAAGLIAWLRVSDRFEAEPEAPPPASDAPEGEELVEVEIVAPE